MSPMVVLSLFFFFVTSSLLTATTVCGINVYKSTQTLEQWRSAGEIPVVDSIIVREGAVSPEWTPYVQSRSALLVSINNVLYTFFSRDADPDRSNLFMEVDQTTSFIVQSRAAYHLEDISVYEQQEEVEEPGVDNPQPPSDLELTASFVSDPQRENLKWLTINYECKRPGVYTISARLQMFDFDERQREITFFWQKSCSEGEVDQQAAAAKRKQGWLARLTDLDPAKPIYEALENAAGERRSPGSSSTGWSFLATSVALMVCAAGAAVLITAVVMDVLDGCFYGLRRDARGGAEKSNEGDGEEEEEGEQGVEDEEKKLPKAPEVVSPPMPIFSTHLIQPDPVAVPPLASQHQEQP